MRGSRIVRNALPEEYLSSVNAWISRDEKTTAKRLDCSVTTSRTVSANPSLSVCLAEGQQHSPISDHFRQSVQQGAYLPFELKAPIILMVSSTSTYIRFFLVIKRILSITDWSSNVSCQPVPHFLA
jgi:hypothetical protein